MAHIDLPPGLPGIRGPMAFRPETARPLSELADVLLHGPSTLTLAEREMIAAHVSARNECAYCRDSHAAIASAHCGDEALVARVTAEGEQPEPICVWHGPSTGPAQSRLPISTQ